MISLTDQDRAKLAASGLIQRRKPSRFECGQMGGRVGGPARAAALSPARRLEIARKASAAAKLKRQAAKRIPLQP